jgi:hypothetical protein
MRLSKIILKLNDIEYFEIKLPDFESIFSTDDLEIFFHGDNVKLQLSNDWASDAIVKLQVLLKKSLTNKLHINKKLKNDLGYLWNERLHQKTSPDFKPSKKYTIWNGLKYHLWATLDDIKKPNDTWLYNDINGNIILKITPTYKWHFGDLDSEPEDDPNFITYDEFIKKYRPYLSRIISKEIAQQWLKQANELWSFLKENERIATLEAENENQ